MKHLIKQYLDRGISRRDFLSGLGSFGISASAANAMARSLAPFLPASDDPKAADDTPSWVREVKGTGGALLVAQLKEAGVEYVFFNPSTPSNYFFDALVDEPNLPVIKAVQEGALAAMADGYAKATGKTPFVICARPGFPNAMTQIFNSWKDQIPMIVAVDGLARDATGQDGSEDADHMESMAQTITKWYWLAESAERIPEITRRAMKFASTPPCGPVFLTFPADTFRTEVKATVMSQSKFQVPMRIRPDTADVERTARMLLDAKSPLLYVGDEVTRCQAQKEVVELAELLGLPVSKEGGAIDGWSYPFPTRHPLWVGGLRREMAYPGAPPDLILNLGSRLPWGERLNVGAKLIQVRQDASNIARTAPTDLGMVGDLKLTSADLLAALRSMAPDTRMKQISQPRAAKIAEYSAEMRRLRESIAKNSWNNSPISWWRLGMELEDVLDKDACYVTDEDTGKKMEDLLSFGGSDKQYFGIIGAALGWALPAAFGVKLGQPQRQVVAVVGDGSFLFSGPQPLWSYARYSAPVIILVCNNRSYNGERNRAWGTGGRQFQTGRDMTCYLGSPDVDFVKVATGFGVQAEKVAEPSDLRPALGRAKRATASGEPYLLDLQIERDGLGAASTWYPPFSIAALREKKV